MKIFFLIAGFLVLSVTSYSQQTDQHKPLTQEDFLLKSKNQRDDGLVLLGFGTTLILIPVIIYATQPYFDITELESPVGPISIFLGAGMMVGSVGLFIASGENKRKAMSLAFKNEATPYIHNGNLLTRGVPSLSLKIGL